MNKRLYILAIVLLGLAATSCTKSDSVDTTWKNANEAAFNGLDASYKSLESQSNIGSVKWKPSNVIIVDTISTKITAAGTPEFTDSVLVRYTGWYIDSSGKQIIFDTTELANNRTPRKFAIAALIDGWRTVLQDMHEGEEREVWIPWQLGYGATPPSSVNIPGYTTLRFNMKLLKIIQMSGRSF